MSFKARLVLMLVLGGIGAIVVYVVHKKTTDDDDPVSHVATAADYGGGTTTMEDDECTSYVVTPTAGNTEVRIRVTPDTHAPTIGTLPSGAIIGSREIRDGYVHLAQPQLGWIPLDQLESHCR